jgi:hypothetical protein
MALINCPECDREVSDVAVMCPQCGYPVRDHVVDERTEVQRTQDVVVRPPTPNRTHQAARPRHNQKKDWRFWVGLVLVVLGGLAVIGGLTRFSNEPVQSAGVFLFNFAIDPLIWGGGVGAFLLYRWRQPQATDTTDTDATPDGGERDPFWIHLH